MTRLPVRIPASAQPPRAYPCRCIDSNDWLSVIAASKSAYQLVGKLQVLSLEPICRNLAHEKWCPIDLTCPHVDIGGLQLKRAAALSSDLGTMPGRDSTFTPAQMERIRDEISRLHRNGCELYVCKKRVADGHGVSVRTVERVWNTRADERLLSDRQGVAFLRGLLLGD